MHVCGVAWSFQTTFPADVWQEAGGQLTPQEAAGLQRWRDATAANAQHPADTGPWVTKEDLEAAGLIDEPYHVQVGFYFFFNFFFLFVIIDEPYHVHVF